jgi:hypothetical protein
VREADAELIGTVVMVLPRGSKFPCGHAIEWGNVRVIAKRLRCRTCLNESSKRSYQRKGRVAPVLGLVE